MSQDDLDYGNYDFESWVDGDKYDLVRESWGCERALINLLWWIRPWENSFDWDSGVEF